MKSKKKRNPLMPQFMVEVTDKNRSKMERMYGFEIPKEVDYIVPPDVVSHSEKFWEGSSGQ